MAKAIIKFHPLVVEFKKNMRDKRNIVIRVNYSKSGKKSEKYLSEPGVVTQWNVKRILLAVGIIVVLLSSALYFFIETDVQRARVQSSGADIDASAKEKIKGNYIKEPSVLIKPQDMLEAVNTIEPETNKPSASIEVEELGGERSISIKEEGAGKKQPIITKQKSVTKKQQVPIVNQNVSRALLTHKIINKEPIGELNLPLSVNKSQAVGVYYFTELTRLKGRTLYHEWLNNEETVFKRRINILGNRWRASSSKLFTVNDAGNWDVRLIDESGHILNKKSFKVIIK